jgi:hypothetical protein
MFVTKGHRWARSSQFEELKVSSSIVKSITALPGFVCVFGMRSNHTPFIHKFCFENSLSRTVFIAYFICVPPWGPNLAWFPCRFRNSEHKTTNRIRRGVKPITSEKEKYPAWFFIFGIRNAGQLIRQLKKKIMNTFPTISGCFVLGCQCFVARIYCDGQYFYWAARLVFGNKRGN